MQRKTIDIVRSLEAKGFKLREGDHHYYIFYTQSGKKTSVFTKTSHGTSEVDDFLLKKMADQCKLTKSKFLDLVDCPMSRQQYEADLIGRGIVKVAPAPA
jgi:hypothetical protein